MPEITVKIEWDWPDEPFWMNADNVAIALHRTCKNTNFVVTDAKEEVLPSGSETARIILAELEQECVAG